jgi:hypothetical protein
MAATDNELFISDPHNSRILVLDANALTTIRSISVDASILQIALAGDGNIWAVIQGTVKKLNGTTGAVISTIANGHVGTIGNIGVLADGTLWVVDNGVNQRIVLFTDSGSTAAQSGYYGDNFGVYGDNGSITSPTKFSFIRGFGRNGTHSYVFWSPGGSGARATKHNDSSGGAIVATLYSLFFLDVPEMTADATKAYSISQEFAVDTTQSLGQQFTHIATTYNPFLYPFDPR